MENVKTNGIKALPENERPREKLLQGGAGSLGNAELLALVIGSGTQRSSALDLAGRILSLESSGISAFAGYSPEEFMRVEGIGKARACVLCAAIELGRRIASSPAAIRIKVDTPKDIAKLNMEEMRRLPKEVFRVAMLNVKSELIMQEDISIGGIAEAASHPREVFAPAIKKGAYAVILLHNHPSGDPTPSKADIKTTEILCEAGKLLGIQVLDHILIGDGRYTSFREEKLIEL